jgi:hypothetical protein
MVKKHMKKIITIGLICLVCFVSLAALSNNPTFSAVQNQNSAVHINLTHQAEHIFGMDFFNVSNPQYLATTGNATLTLLDGREAGNYTALYSFKLDANETSPPGGWSGDAMVVNSKDGHNKTCFVPNQMYQYFANQVNGTIELWLWIPDYQGSAEHTLTLLADDSDAGENKSVAIQFRYGGNPPETWDGIWVWNYTVLGGCNTFMADLIHESWFHIQIDFDCHQYVSNYNVTYNGTQFGPYLYEYGYEAIHTSWLKIDAVGAQVSYIDAIDYSWASGYYENRNLYLDGDYAYEGSYVSSIIDLGEYNNYYLEYINLSYDTPSDSEIAVQAQFSVDNEMWSGWLPLIGLPNVTGGVEIGRYSQFMINLTASSDTFDTPELYDLLVQFEETVLNEYPSFADIAPANNSIGLGPDVPINCTILDADADLLNISLYVNDTLINSASNCDNGSLYYYLFHGNYSTTYTFYFELTDGENTTISDLYLFTTGDEPEEEEPAIHAATVDDLFIAIGAVGFVLLTAAANIRKRRV